MKNLTEIDLTYLTNDIPAQSKEIESNSFSNSALKSIILPLESKKIGAYAFYNLKCTITGLESMNNLTTVGQYAFANTSTLNPSLTLPSAITEIEENAFYNTGITSLNIGEIESIGAYAFAENTKLHVTVKGSTVPTIEPTTFIGEQLSLNVDLGMKVKFQEDENWNSLFPVITEQ